MKKFLILLFFPLFSFAKAHHKDPNPFILQGQLLNYPATELHLTFTNKHGNVNETINVDQSGRFYFECPVDELDGPVAAQLKQPNAFRANLFIAPGYKLTINADCKINRYGVTKNKSIEGFGSAANKYLFKRDSILFERSNKKDWFQLNAQELVIYENANKHLCDSLIQVVFSQKPPPDEYYNYFKKYIELDNKFARVDHITWHTVIDTTLKGYQQTVDFVAKNIDTTIFSDLFEEKYLALGSYQDFMMNGYYQYLNNLGRKKSPLLYADNSKYRLYFVSIINEVYKGKIKDWTLYNQLHDAFEFCRSWDELQMYKKAFPPYIAELPTQKQKDEIENLAASQEAKLLPTQVGKPAPEFTAQDSLGKVYDLANYKGKVVLLDLWASWCGPCRYQTPYLAKIVEKYKADNGIAFISLGILDEHDKWKMAMAQDKPTWLQLFDNNGMIPDAYVAHSIPKFIIISKQGNVVSFDAPMPSDSAQLEKILDAELSK